MGKYRRSTNRLPLGISLAAIFWLADTLLLSVTSGQSFAVALWSGAPPARLLLRLSLLMALLLWGFTSVMLQEWRSREFQQMSPARRRHTYGSPDSPARGDRLYYYALRLATLMRMRARERENLRLLCYCHDIGLIGVPDQLLDRAGDWGLSLAPLPPGAVRFSNAEQSLYDRHVDLGAEIAAAIPQLTRTARLICCHEEHYDGGGPKSLYGRSIPLACRIFAVVRMYDFFITPHDGGRVMESAEALDELDLYAGSQLDPDVVAAFRRLLTDKRLSAAAWQEIYLSQ